MEEKNKLIKLERIGMAGAMLAGLGVNCGAGLMHANSNNVVHAMHIPKHGHTGGLRGTLIGTLDPTFGISVGVSNMPTQAENTQTITADNEIKQKNTPISDDDFDNAFGIGYEPLTPETTPPKKIDPAPVPKPKPKPFGVPKTPQVPKPTYSPKMNIIDQDSHTTKTLNGIEGHDGDKLLFTNNDQSQTVAQVVKDLQSKHYDVISINNTPFKDINWSDKVYNEITNTHINVEVKHHLTKVERNKDVHENIHYKVTDNAGNTTTEVVDTKPVLHFTQTGVQDTVTGQIKWNGNSVSQAFSSINVAKKTGYIASVQTIPAKTVTITNDNWNKNHDIDVTIKYTPVPITKHEATPQPQKPTRTPEDTSVFKQNISAQKNNNNLPEMAEAKQDLAMAGLGVSSLLGLVSLAGVQVKKRVRKNGKNQA